MEDKDIEPTLKEFFETKREIDVLGRRLNKLKADILAWQGEDQVKTVGSYQSKVSNCTKVTLLETIAATRHGIRFDNDDYKITPYVKLKVKKIY